MWKLSLTNKRKFMQLTFVIFLYSLFSINAHNGKKMKICVHNVFKKFQNKSHTDYITQRFYLHLITNFCVVSSKINIMLETSVQARKLFLNSGKCCPTFPLQHYRVLILHPLQYHLSIRTVLISSSFSIYMTQSSL